MTSKAILLPLLFAALLSLSACGSATTSIQEPDPTAATTAAQTTATTTQTTAPATTTITSVTTTLDPSVDFQAKCDEINALIRTETVAGLCIDMDAEAVRTLLGDPETESEPVLNECDAVTLKTWDYPARGISITLQQTPDSWTVRSYIVSGDAETSSGVSIGGSRASLIAAYEDHYLTPDIDFVEEDVRRNATLQNFSPLVIGSWKFGYMEFTIENDLVTSISAGYGTSA